MNSLLEIAETIIEAGKELYAAGLSPATSSNYSMRIDENTAAITVSGKHKGKLTTDDVMLINNHGLAIDSTKKPSAETLLHTQIYKLFPHINAVLHTHSVNATVLSRMLKTNVLVLSNYEMLKAFDGITTHETSVIVPIFPNDQDMNRLAKKTEEYFKQADVCFGYLIAGHGLYTWGKTMQDTMRHIEAFEFLFSCELKQRGIM